MTANVDRLANINRQIHDVKVLLNNRANIGGKGYGFQDLLDELDRLVGERHRILRAAG